MHPTHLTFPVALSNIHPTNRQHLQMTILPLWNLNIQVSSTPGLRYALFFLRPTFWGAQYYLIGRGWIKFTNKPHIGNRPRNHTKNRSNRTNWVVPTVSTYITALKWVKNCMCGLGRLKSHCTTLIYYIFFKSYIGR